MPNLRYEVLVREYSMTNYRYIIEGPDSDISAPQNCVFTDAAHIIMPSTDRHPDYELSQFMPSLENGVIYARLLDDTDTRPSDYVVDENGTPVT